MVRIICNTLHTDYGIDRKRIVEETDLSQLIARMRKALGDNRETKQFKSETFRDYMSMLGYTERKE